MEPEPLSCLFECMTSVMDLLDELDDTEWRSPSLCPGWDVAAVVAHLDAIEEVLSGWRPDGDTPAPFDQVATIASEVSRASRRQAVERCRATLDRRRAELSAAPPDLFTAPSWTPVGVQTYGRFMAIRTFDFWVHEQDIRVPLGRPGHLSGPAAELALDEVRRSFGYIVGKKARIPDGKSVRVVLHGPVEAELCAEVDGRARLVERLERADAVVETDSLTFMLLACGRIDPAGTLDTDAVRLGGDLELATRLATNLAFTF